jgi:hypothetical protein
MSSRRRLAFTFITCLAASCGGGSATSVVTNVAPSSVCAASLSMPSVEIDASGANGQLTVSLNRECQWSARSDVDWIELNPQSGQGSSTIAYAIAANGAGAARRGSVAVNDQHVDIAQAAAPCRFSLSTQHASVDPTGGRLTVAVGTQSACPWSAKSQASWIQIVDGASSHTGNGTLTLRVDPNGATPRSGTVTVGDQAVIISQDAAAPGNPAPGGPCTFTLSPAGQSVDETGGGGTVSVSGPPGCAWNAGTSASWITITGGANGTGPGAVQYTVGANPTTSARVGTLTVAGLPFTIRQEAAQPAPASCTFTLSATTQSVQAGASSGQITVTASSPTCAWFASTTTSWLTISSGASGVGNGTTTYTIAANTTPAPRTGTVTVAGQTVTVTQAAAPPAAPPPAAPPCTFTLSATSQSPGSSAGTAQIAITASAPTCAWTATTATSWLSISSGASGTGNGTTTYAFTANTATSARSGTLTVAGQTVSVTQAAAPPSCTFTASPTSASVSASAGTGQVTVTASAPTCPWTASTATSWLSISAGASGTGNGTTSFAFAANSSTSSRTGTLTVAGTTINVTQAAQLVSVSGKVMGKSGACPNLTLTLNGNTPVVRTNAQTSFAVACTDLGKNDRIAVTGLLQSDGSIVASSVSPN